MLNIKPLILQGRVVRLEPLAYAHIPDLTAAAQDEDIWRHMVYGNIRTQADMHRLVADLLGRQERNTDLPFAVIHRQTGHAIGMTRYMDIRPLDRALEVGGTWYAPEYQRTAVNSECKYLLLQQAFEGYGCIRVQFKTDLRNVQSQKALERIGAVREGVLRSHIILPDGFIRDSVYYSILASEWPQVKQNLEEKLRG